MNSNQTQIKAKDLTKEYPRSPRETLGGYVIAARVLDKCRSVIAGMQGEYHFDCPLDHYFLDYAGISAESFRCLVATGANDEEVAAWITTHDEIAARGRSRNRQMEQSDAGDVSG